MPWIDDDPDYIPEDDSIGRIDTITTVEAESGTLAVFLFGPDDKPLLLEKPRRIGYVRN